MTDVNIDILPQGLIAGAPRLRDRSAEEMIHGAPTQLERAGQSFYTIDSLARRLSVSPRTVQNWLARGELVSYAFGKARRIDPVDVEAFLAERRDGGRSAV